jgi:hypothetical protein
VGIYVPSHRILKDTFLVVPVPLRSTLSVPEHEPGLGLVNLLLFDCQGANVRDGRFETVSGRIIYTNPSDDGTRAAGPTFGWAIDAAPGLVEVRAYKDDLFVAAEQVPVRADTVTYMTLLPIAELPVRFQ